MGNNIPDNMNNVLNEVMDYKPTGNVLDTNNHVFDEDPDKDDADVDERDVVQIDGLVQSVKPCLLDDVSQFSVRYEYVLLARPAKARR